MLKKPITYEDFFTQEKITEDFYFNLTRSELVELEADYEGGLEATIKRIIKAEDQKSLIKEFKRIILMSYGKKVGNKFDKSEEAKKEFSESAAYDALFMELATSDEAAAIFVNGVMPKELADEIKDKKSTIETVAAEKTGVTPPPPPPSS